MIEDLENRPEQIQKLASWHLKEWPELAHQDRVDLIKPRSGKTLLPKTFMMVLDGGGWHEQTAGFVSLDHKTLLAGRCESPWLTTLLVGPEFRGKGVGRSLVQFCCEYVKKIGYSTLYLHTTEAPDFYRKLGWEQYEYDDTAGRTFFRMKL